MFRPGLFPLSGKARCAWAIAPAMLLAACGPNREEELERQLAEAKASAEQEASARQQAEREAAAARLKANDAELAKFYQGETEPEAEEPEASSPDSTGDSSPVSPPPAGFQADGRPIGDQMPAPR